jgi:hypothetical protein
MGHPMTAKAHIMNATHWRWTRHERSVNIDDPGAYMKPIEHTIMLRPSNVAFMQKPELLGPRQRLLYGKRCCEMPQNAGQIGVA